MPRPIAWKRDGTGLVLVAISQFHDVVVTTIGTIQGSSSSTLNSPAWGIPRSSSARPRPISQLPKTPTMVKIAVNSTADQNAELWQHDEKFDSPTNGPLEISEPLCSDWSAA